VKVLRSCFLILILNVLFCASLHASATHNEYERCAKISTFSLQYCIKDQLQNASESCWVDSRKAYLRCKKEIREEHDPQRHRRYQKVRMEAERKAKEQGLDKLQK